MCTNLKFGSYRLSLFCNTLSRSDLNYLQGGRGNWPLFTLIGENGERNFAISPGLKNPLQKKSIPAEVIAGGSGAGFNLLPDALRARRVDI